ncbi:PPC domain-containing DNA-binding protein [Burkholderiaceae bacterium UC74_6]
MKPLPLRLHPGVDLRGGLAAALAEAGGGSCSAFVLSGIGSLSRVALRLAGANETLQLDGELEILSLAGTLGPDGAHLHMSIADASGRVLGGHVGPGCIVRTTAEVLLAVLDDWELRRTPDPATGFLELQPVQKSSP